MDATRISGDDRSSCSHRLRGDERAVLGMPFRLLISLVSFALVAPIVQSGWTSVDYVQTERRIQGEIAKVLLAAQRYLQAGFGGETLEVAIGGGTFTHVEYVIFGDAPGGPYSRAVRYRLSGGQEEIMTVRNPSVPLVSRDGTSLLLVEGNHSILLECLDSESVTLWPVG